MVTSSSPVTTKIVCEDKEMPSGPLDPSPETTLVILLGAKEWPKVRTFNNPPEAFENAIEGLKSYFKDIFGLPPENLKCFFNTKDTPAHLSEKIAKFLRESQSKVPSPRDLLIYYVGHGAFIDGREFALTLYETDLEDRRSSTLSIASLAARLKAKEASYLRRILILDCCFAGAAVPYFLGTEGEVAFEQTKRELEEEPGRTTLPQRGTALLGASSSHDPAFISPDQNNTMYSKALVEVLKQGDASLGERLSLRNVHDLVTKILNVRPDYAPPPVLHSPDQSGGGEIASIPFFPNLAHSAVKTLYPFDCGKALAWSPDGRRIAFGSPEGSIYIWTQTMSDSVAYSVHQGRVRTLAWSPDGISIASACGSEVLIWWPMGNQYEITCRLSGIPMKPVQALSWSPNGNRLAVAQRGIVQVWRVDTPLSKPVTHEAGDGSAAAVEAVAWSPSAEQNQIASGCGAKVEIWNADLEGGTRVYNKHPNIHVVNSLAWSTDGKYIASASDVFWPGQVHVWDAHTLQQHVQWDGGVKALAWAPFERTGAQALPPLYRVATAGIGNLVSIREALTGNETSIYKGHKGNITVIAWSPDGKQVASGSRDKTIKVWKANLS